MYTNSVTENMKLIMKWLLHISPRYIHFIDKQNRSEHYRKMSEII